MNNYLTLFDNNVAQARSLSTIYINLRDGVHIEDVYNNNLLKAQLVNVVSAFDMFIHGIVKKGVIEIFNKTRKETPKFQTFAFQAKTILKLIEVMSPGFMPSSSDEIPDVILEKELSDKLSFMSFQSPDKVTDALSLIWGEPHKLQVLAADMNISGCNTNEKANNLKQELTTIIQRRNQIAHEGDINPATHLPRSIELSDVNKASDFITSLGHAVFRRVTAADCYNLKYVRQSIK